RVRVTTLCANPANELHGEESSSQHAVPPNRDGHFTPNSTGEPILQRQRLDRHRAVASIEIAQRHVVRGPASK
ncbi:MAG: hypothetical protein ACR2JH_04725, partial [Solirubrobacteraceae bacterium]